MWLSFQEVTSRFVLLLNQTTLSPLQMGSTYVIGPKKKREVLLGARRTKSQCVSLKLKTKQT